MWRREDVWERCYIGQKQDQGELAQAGWGHCKEGLIANVGCSTTHQAAHLEIW